MKKEDRHIIWTNDSLDFEKDWLPWMKDDYPERTEDELYSLMYEINSDDLADERYNLDIHMDTPIVLISDIERWNGRVYGCRLIKSRNIKDCLYSGCDYVTWYVDRLGDLRCEASHHDGTNYYLYRALKPTVSDEQYFNFKNKAFSNTLTRKDITRYTSRLGDEIAGVYGWTLTKRRGKEKTYDVR